MSIIYQKEIKPNDHTPYLIIIDLDGTLMFDLTTYNEETFAYLKDLKNSGHLIMIATGRPLRSSYFVYQLLDLNTPIINYNGSWVSHPKDSQYELVDHRINRFDLFELLDKFEDGIINCFCEIHDDIYIRDYSQKIWPFLHVDGGIVHEGDFKINLPDNPNGALLFVRHEYCRALEEFITEHYQGKMFSRTWPSGDFEIVEIYNCLVDKGEGVKVAQKYYGIDREHTIAIGDAHNDLGMFKAAGISVAMGQGHPLAKELADVITDDIHHNGVMTFLKSYFK